jgi:hypothetical protein
MKIKPEDVLKLGFYSQDLERDITVREWLLELLATLWIEKEGFYGKRPFGNSNWTSDLAAALIKAGFMKGEIDEDGYVLEYDDNELDVIMRKVIEELHS